MKRSFLIVLIFAASIYSQLPYTFEAGAVARASEMNANLTFLLNKIDSLSSQITKITTLTNRIDSLKNRADSLKNKADSLNTRIVSLEKMRLPVGAILASMITIDTSDGIWVLADGRTATTEYFQATGNNKIPDLRGQFLRGLNAGRIDGGEDPEGSSRLAGSYQADTVKNHNHVNGAFTYLLQSNSGINSTYNSDISPGEPDLINIKSLLPYGGAETRPRNSAVYWYIRVK